MTGLPRHSEGRLVVLGAGRPLTGRVPSAVRVVDKGRKVLDWTLHAFSTIATDVTFVGGYVMNDVVAAFPKIRFALNPNWDTTGATGSLLASRPDDGEIWVCYSDILVRPELIQRLDEIPHDAIAVSIDTMPVHDPASGRRRAGVQREQVSMLGDSITTSDQGKPAEFVGCIRLPAGWLSRIDGVDTVSGRPLRRTHLSGLISALLSAGLPVRAVEANGLWTDLEDERGLAAFVFGTKAETLDRLSGRLRNAHVPRQFRFTVERWRSDPRGVIADITRRFEREKLAVRSSGLFEDGLSQSNAGKFDSLLNVDCRSQALPEAVEAVISSYGGDADGGHQVLVQPMVKDVALSGVLLTRTPHVGGPYYTLACTEDGSTDAVTSGRGQDQRTFVVHRSRNQLPASLPLGANTLLDAVAEIEFLTDSDALDVEFAVDRAGQVHLLQARPLVLSSARSPDAEIWAERLLIDAGQRFESLRAPSPGIVGARPAWGMMPDWNPAEIIGARPSALAFSLYDNLICAEIWATQRAEYGYRDVRPWPLIRQFAGHAYVDVRASFNSFVPAGVPDEAAAQLVDAYVRRLQENPEFHDKVEFTVALTAWSFDLEDRLRQLDAGFLARDNSLSQLPDHLARITRDGIARVHSDVEVAEAFGRLLDARSSKAHRSLQGALALTDLCRRHGTLPFAHLARGGFVAAILLRSAVAKGLLDPERVEAFHRSIHSVSHAFVADAWNVHSGSLSFDAFVRIYGHLRPGTYDVASSSYGADPHRFLMPAIERASRPHVVPFAWAEGELSGVLAGLADVGIVLDATAFDRFLRAAIEGRERSKFVFTRALSWALDGFAQWARDTGLDLDDLACLSLADLAAVNLGTIPASAEYLRSRSAEHRRVANAADLIELPPLLFDPSDLLSFEQPRAEPNFVTRNSVVAPIVVVDGSKELPDLAGKVVLIPRADPGYDWLFGREIAGLVTMFGGANSHMAIRAAEFGLPAAIGIGSLRYRDLRQASMIELNCRERRITMVGG